MSELPELGKGYKRGDEVIILGRNDILSEEDANEVIHRCSCHDDLVAACVEAGKMLNLCARTFLNTGEPPDPNKMTDVICNITAALAQVRKGSYNIEYRNKNGGTK